MRKFVLLLALVSVVALAGYTTTYTSLGAGVKSAPIIVSSIPDGNIYVIVAQEDGEMRMYNINNIDETHTYVWSESLGSNITDVLSAGGHVYAATGTGYNLIAIAPMGKGLEFVEIDENKATVDSLVDQQYWNDLVGGVAVFEASPLDAATEYIGAVGISEDGHLVARVYGFNGNNVATETDLAVVDFNERAYSSVAVADVTKGPSGSAKVYIGTDEHFYVYKFRWDLNAATSDFVPIKTISIPGKAQSGIALDDNAAYFLTYGLDKFWFNVYPRDGDSVTSYAIEKDAGQSLDGYPVNSPVVVQYDSGNIVYYAVGKAVYYYDTSTYSIGKIDVGEPIFAAPIVLSDKDNPENSMVFVVTSKGNVYRLNGSTYAAEKVSSACAQGDGYVYTPPAARGGKLVFAVTKVDGTGRLCSVDISDVSYGAQTGMWASFGYADGRTQTLSYNPPFKIPIFVKAFIQNGSSLDNTGVYATYTTSEMSGDSTLTFNGIVNVPTQGAATVVAVDYETDVSSVVPATDASYVFQGWIDDSSAGRARYKDDIENSEIWKASYKLYYKIRYEIINYMQTSDIIATNDIWVEAYEATTLSDASYVPVRWEVYYTNTSTPDIVSTDTELSLSNVNTPMLVKEYVMRTYGTVEFKYQKYFMEPIEPYNKFLMTLKVTRLSTENAGAGATSIKAFDMVLDLSSLPFDVSIYNATYVLNLNYPANVSATTDKLWFEKIVGDDNKSIEFLVMLSTPVSTASDIFMATITLEYSGSGFPKEAAALLSDVANMTVGDGEALIGAAKVNRSGVGSMSDDFILEYLPYSDKLGDFNNDGCVDIFDLMALANHYGLDENSVDWIPIYDIGPRTGYTHLTPSSPGELVIETPRKVDFNDLLIEGILYGQDCE